MPSTSKTDAPPSGLVRIVKAAYRLTASLKVAVILLVIFAIVLAGATILEKEKGREYAQWYVYDSYWFMGLLGLLAVNILAATLIRFPWRVRQTGFLIAHAGLLVLLAGSIQTFVSGIEGQLGFSEGETVDAFLLTDNSQIKLLWLPASDDQEPTGPIFVPGPTDWPADKTLDLGETDDVGIKILKFYRHARYKTDWGEDETGFGRPVLELRVADSQGESIDQAWYPANPFGGRSEQGQPNFQFQQVPLTSMLEDFLDPPEDLDPEGQGQISVHCDGRVYPIDVEKNVGQKVPVGENGISVEIVAYYASAILQGGGRFASASPEPRNPMLQLNVHVPGMPEPIPEIAFSKSPLVNYELMRRQPCPVRFWYHHPASTVFPGAEFLQTPDGKLFCRVGIDGKRQSLGEVVEGDRLELADGFEATVLHYFLHAREEATFYPIELASGETSGPDAAVRVELDVGGRTHETWLARNRAEFGPQRIETHKGPLLVTLGYEKRDLEFSLKLLDFKLGLNPGGMGAASYASDVRLIDKKRNIDREQKIWMNNPLVHEEYVFHQSSYELHDGKESSSLGVAYDPGRFLKYLGSLMICLGSLVMFCLKGYSARPKSSRKSKKPSDEGQRSKISQ